VFADGPGLASTSFPAICMQRGRSIKRLWARLPAGHTSFMSPLTAAASMVFSLAIAVGAAPAGTSLDRGISGPSPMRPGVALTHSASPSHSLRLLARRNHARFTAGPSHRHGGLFGAYSVVSTDYCCNDPHNALQLVRWRDDHWVTDGTLHAVEDNAGNTHAWNFPDYSLYAERVRSAAGRAPLFGGAVNATYPSAHMVAVRTRIGWRWARFIRCRRLAGCSHPTVRGTVVLNPRVSRGRLTSRVSSCTPSCGAPHQVVHVITFAWRAARRAFVEVHVHKTHL
jgi:hypothetical protein